MTKARTNADNASADIQGVTAGTGLTGGGTSGTVTLTNDMATAIDAKGDLVVGTGADTYDNLAAGANGETLVADSSTSTGLRYTAGNPIPNPVLNSAMQVWQRGTSIAGSTTAFSADRWQSYRAVAGSTFSRQSTNDTTNLPNIQYCLRVQRDSGNTSTTAIALLQNFETINSIPYSGKTVTLSFYARAGANFSQASSTLPVILYSGTGTDQNTITGYTGQTAVVTGNAVLTTTWQRFTYTGTVATSATELAIYAGNFNPVGTAGANDYYEITGVQIDIGSVALPFRTYAGTIQGELAACLYYFNRIADFSAGGSNGQQMIVTAQNFATTGGFGVLQYPKMRISPTVSFSGNADFIATGAGGNNIATTAMQANSIKPNSVEIRYTTAGSLSAGDAALLYTTTTTGKLDLSAEL